MQSGYVFLCDSSSLTSCMRNKNFSCTGDQVKVAQELDLNTIIFLLNEEKDSLLGPFTVTEGPEDLEKGAWYSSVQRDRFSGNIKLEWEGLHELENASQKLPYLKDLKKCSLSALETQEVLAELKNSPFFPGEEKQA
jgi:hypothetical protein